MIGGALQLPLLATIAAGFGRITGAAPQHAYEIVRRPAASELLQSDSALPQARLDGRKLVWGGFKFLSAVRRRQGHEQQRTDPWYC
jgi:hypothetical protein